MVRETRGPRAGAPVPNDGEQRERERTDNGGTVDGETGSDTPQTDDTAHDRGGSPRRKALATLGAGVVGAVFGFPIVSRSARAEVTRIQEPTVIEEPGAYELADDIHVDGRAGIIIERRDVTLDGNGHVIRGTESQSERSRGISVELEAQNVTIRDVTVRNCGASVVSSDYADFAVYDSVFEDNRGGLGAGSSAQCVVEGCEIVGNGGGMSFPLQGESRLVDTELRGNDGGGVEIRYSDATHDGDPIPIRNCRIQDNDGPGIEHGNDPLAIEGCVITGNRDGYVAEPERNYSAILRNNTITDNEQYGITLSAEWEFETGFDARFNDLSNNGSGAIHSSREESVSTPLNYFGEDGTDVVVTGNVCYEPLLTVPPSELDGRDGVTDYGSYVEIEADEPAVIGFPAPSARSIGRLLSEAFIENGAVYRYDVESARFEPLADRDYRPRAGEVIALTAGDEPIDEAMIVEIDTGPDDAVDKPETVPVQPGWNLVSFGRAAGSAADLDTAPPGVLRDEVTLQAQPTLPGTEPTGDIGPFDGIWTFAEDAGEIKAEFFEGQTATEYARRVLRKRGE